MHNKSRKSGSASVAETLEYFLKFQFLTNIYIKIWKLKNRQRDGLLKNEELYQNYLEETDDNRDETGNTEYTCGNKYCDFIDKEIFGPINNNNNVIVKPNNSGIVSKSASNVERRPTDDIIRHNLQKVLFYEQNVPCISTEDIFVCIFQNYFTFYLYTI